MNKLTIQNIGGEHRHKVFLNDQEIEGIEELNLKMDAKGANVAIMKVRCREINVEALTDKENIKTIPADIPTLDRKYQRTEPVYMVVDEIRTPDNEYQLAIAKRVKNN